MATCDNTSRDKWRELFDHMHKLADAGANENETLKATVKTLKHDISIWRRAAAAGDNVQDAMALCVVDGSRTMFSEPYLRRGQVGGRFAAERLLSCIQERLESSKDDHPNLNVYNVSMSVYCAKARLAESLESRGVCDTGLIDAFFAGFGQASTLISIVDVIDEDSVDDKIMAYLRTFAGLPQVTHVFYAGGWDSPMASITEALDSLGARDKLYFVRSSGGTAPATITLEGIVTDITVVDEVPIADKDCSEGEPGRPSSLRPPRSVASSPVNTFSAPFGAFNKQRPTINPNLPLDRQNPHPCNEFYLMGECPKADRCRYEHHYELTDEQLKELASIAKSLPCAYVNAGQECWYGVKCCWGHVCPHGIKCWYLSKGTCRFKAAGMHRSQFTGALTSPTWRTGAREKTL